MGLKPTKIKVFNQFDEFGLLAGLGHWINDGKVLDYVRYPGETNAELKQRTLTANKYRGNATLQGMVNNISRDLSIGSNYPIYNIETKNIFYLSEKPYPSASGVKVYVNDSLIEPQVRASGYANAVSGWIVWNQADYNPALMISGTPMLSDGNIEVGEYTQILEFIGSSIPDTDDKIKVEYEVQTGFDLTGQPVLNWRSDFSNIDDPTDLTFIGKKSEFPANSGDYNTFKTSHISIFTLDNLKHPSISGVFYDTDGKPTETFINIANRVNKEYPLYWDQFKYDIGRWGQLDEAAVGSIPSFHDESIISGCVIKGGSNYGIDLDCVSIKKTGDNPRDPWYPLLAPGEFYIGDENFYLFGDMKYYKLDLTPIGGGILSGNIPYDVNNPIRLNTITAYSSGIFFDEASGVLPNNPYFKRIHNFNNPISGVYYRTPYISHTNISYVSMQFDGYNFYYDYDNRIIYASGVNPSGFVLAWDNLSSSGNLVLYSGGYSLNTIDFNPLNNPFDKAFYIE